MLVKMQIRNEYQTKEGAVWRVKLADLRDVTAADPAGFPSVCDVGKQTGSA